MKHCSVGAIIRRNNRYLLIERRNIPYGSACIADHKDPNETDEDVVDREVKEESKLVVLKSTELILYSIQIKINYEHASYDSV